mmetsp:Transcript_69799/g.110953  ORF Transcript_69799/g.110953 Transcript_69799/m.110953 type:complete len:202 (-) Transcript_69799:1334-1939(-)
MRSQCNIGALLHDLCFANFGNLCCIRIEPIIVDRKLGAVHDFVLHQHAGIRVANTRFKQRARIHCVVDAHYFESRALRVPRAEILRMLSAHCLGRPVAASKCDRHVDGAAAHIPQLARTVHDLIDGLHAKVERHKLHDWMQSVECRADAHSGKSHLCDRRINHSRIAIFVPQSLGDFVGAIILRHLLAHQEQQRVTLKFLK